MTVESSKAAKVRAYAPVDKPAVLELIECVWGQDIRNDHAFFWDWKHALDGSCPKGNNIAQVIEIDGKIVGYTGAIPVKFKMGESVLDGIFCMDTFTAPDSRGSGVRLMKHQLKIVSITLGAAVPRAKELWNRLAKKDDVVIKNAQKIVRLVNPSSLLVQKGVPPLLIKPICLLWGSVNFFFDIRNKIHFGAQKIRLERVDDFPRSVDALCSDFLKDFQYCALRDHKYLNWRFSSCPFKYEKMLLWDDQRLCGYMVFRTGVLNGRRIMILVEIMAVGMKKEYYGTMLSRLYEIAKRQSVSDIQTIDNGDAMLTKELKRHGYIVKKEQISVIGRVHDDLYDDNDIYGDSKWFLGAGDADFEFIFFKQGVNSVVRCNIE